MSEESKNVERPSGGDISKQRSYNDVKNDPLCSIHGQLEQKRKIGTWTARWCAVWNGQFFCYKDENDVKPQVFFPLQGFQISAIQIPQKPFTFQLSKLGIEHVFAADQWTTFQRWMQQLARANVTTEADSDAQTNTSEQEEEKTKQEGKNEDKIPPLARHVSVDESEPTAKEKPTSTPGLHVSHSFDSAEVLIENSLHRSNEVEDLLSLQDTYLSSGSPALSSSLKRCHEVEDLRHLGESEDAVVAPSATERSRSTIELSFVEEIMDPEAKALLGVSVEQLKQLFSNGKDTPPPSPKPQVKLNSAKTFKRANSLPQLPAAVHIEGPLNVALELSHEVQWRPMWGTTKAECLFVFVHEGASQPRHVLPLDGVDVRPAALDTGRLLAVQLVRQGRMQLIIEPPNVEELGKWVSTLFHIIQQASLNDNKVKNSSVSSYEVRRGSTHRSISNPDRGFTEPYFPKQNLTSQPAMISSPDGSGELVSVREVASLFETTKSPSNRPASRKSSSSSNGHLNNHQESFRKNPDFLSDSDAQKIKYKLEASYADVVCWLGPYIEQEEEKKVLNNVANPFLAKLRLRHKIELISQLKDAATETTKKIQNLEERLLTKEVSKMTAAKKNQGRLVRNAEDARRVDNERKRIEKECATIEGQIKQETRRLKELEETVALTELEVKSTLQQIETDSSEPTVHPNENGVTTQDDSEDGIDGVSEVPEWTKKAKEKSQVWKKLSAEYN